MRSTDTPKRKKLYGADLFCGAGGTSQGLLMAANDINVDLELIAVNHWQTAIDTHTVNHPYARNLCTGLDEVDPLKLVPGAACTSSARLQNAFQQEPSSTPIEA